MFVVLSNAYFYSVFELHLMFITFKSFWDVLKVMGLFKGIQNHTQTRGAVDVRIVGNSLKVSQGVGTLTLETPQCIRPICLIIYIIFQLIKVIGDSGTNYRSGDI